MWFGRFQGPLAAPPLKVVFSPSVPQAIDISTSSSDTGVNSMVKFSTTSRPSAISSGTSTRSFSAFLAVPQMSASELKNQTPLVGTDFFGP